MSLPLLSDREVQQFITEGYIVINAAGPPGLHAGIHTKLEAVFTEEGNVGNNILPRIPEIRHVFNQPAVRGALTSLLGTDYVMNPHRHAHLNPPGRAAQDWHKDCYVYDHNLRSPRFRWILALYYPHDVDPDMGPTGILPGAQWLTSVSDPDQSRSTERAGSLAGPAGTIALLNFDAWHAGTANTSERDRYMLKFQFARMSEPTVPTWSFRDDWTPPQHLPHRLIAGDVWRWLTGAAAADGVGTDSVEGADGAVAALADRLCDADEGARLDAAYALAARGVEAIPTLASALAREAQTAAAGIEDKTPDNLHGTNPTALPAAQGLVAAGAIAVGALVEALGDHRWLVRCAAADALGRFGTLAVAAVPDLVARLGDPHWWVRRNVVESLARIGTEDDATVSLIIERIADEDHRVRRVAALALAQIGLDPGGAVGALARVLEDEDRYIRFYAALALRRLDSADARERLLDELFAARWCPLTSAQNRF